MKHRYAGLGAVALSLMIGMAAPGAAMADNFGAIAYSPNKGHYGYSYDYNSQRGAENRAMSECRSNGSGCRIATWFRNACGALAKGPNGWGADWGNDRWEAESKAMAQCSKHTRSCGVIRWVCVTR